MSYEAPKTMAAPVCTNQVNQVIRHPRTTFREVVVNVNECSVSADAPSFIPNYHNYLLPLFFFAAPGQSFSSFRWFALESNSRIIYLDNFLLFYIDQIY